MQKRIPNIKINGDLQDRLSGNASVSFEGINGSELLFELDKQGICASAGSACSTANPTPSHVLTAIGLSSQLADSTLRISFGKSNTKEDVDFLVENIAKMINEKM